MVLFAALAAVAVAAQPDSPAPIDAGEAGEAGEASQAEAVSVATLDRWLQSAAADLAAAENPDAAVPENIGGGGAWRFVRFGQPILVIASEDAGRMRIITPVVSAQGGPVRPDEAAMRRVLEANFSSALDARYVLHRGELWAAYLHPLGGLDEVQLRSGLQQVLNLGITYGTTYTSSGLRFGGDEPAERGPADKAGDPGGVV